MWPFLSPDARVLRLQAELLESDQDLAQRDTRIRDLSRQVRGLEEQLVEARLERGRMPGGAWSDHGGS
jgi:hypothetical protein